jgi:hypothetical protein
MRVWIVALLLATLTGCATWQEDARKNDYDKVTRAYAKTLEWSDFESLASFVEVKEGVAPPAASSYKDIKVTSYQPGRANGSADGKIVRRSAKISYLLLERMSERTLSVQEEWVYSEPLKRWFLQSGLPVFR